MGYYTRFALSIHQDGKNYVYDQDAIKQLIEHVDYHPFWEACKWYDHEEHMKWLSEQWPDTVFLLEGEGEEAGDMWKKYFKNGEMQVCKAIITYPPYDESQLH